MLSDLYIKGIKVIEPQTSAQDYFFALPAVKSLMVAGGLDLSKRVTMFVGENGSGKSTLLEAIAVAYGFNAEGGTKNFNFASQQTHSELYQYLTVIKGVRRATDGFFLRAESFYNVASEVDKLYEFEPESPYGGKSLHKQSHGESFMALVQNRFSGNGLYILDEPEAALSPSRQLSLLVHINNLVKSNSQFIIATHSPLLMAYPGADIFLLTENGLELTPYQQTEHYILTKQFLDNPERMLSYLFEES